MGSFKENPKLQASAVSGAVFVIAMIVDLVLLHYQEWSTAEGLAALIAGGSAGWMFGMILSPYGKKDTDKFTEYGAAICSVAGGAIGTLLIGVTSKAADQGLLWKGAFWHPFMLFLGAFLVGIVITFVFRKYL